MLVLAGAVQAVRLVAGGGETHAEHVHPTAAPPTDIGRDIRTSFGVVAAESVRTLGGLGARPLAGVTHGIQNLVGPGQMQVQVLVGLNNELSHPIAYGPGRFALRVGRSRTLRRPRAGTLPTSTLQPNASIEGALVFVAPRSRGRLVLQFSDRSGPVLLDLGRAAPGRAPTYGQQQHHH